MVSQVVPDGHSLLSAQRQELLLHPCWLPLKDGHWLPLWGQLQCPAEHVPLEHASSHTPQLAASEDVVTSHWSVSSWLQLAVPDAQVLMTQANAAGSPLPLHVR